MSKNLPLCDYSINEIYCTNQKQYAIPIYQRNYAWGSVEIEALINDVKQAMDLRKEAYYIGTLVTYARANNEYEVIDGQQRLTTIYLILQALGVLCRSTLTYISRSVSASTLKNLEQTEGNVDKEIIEGYKIAKAAIRALDDENEFREYFCKNVHIIHYEVPQDVDLNHYFEVMNSRGEQLEMHEIVKSLLGGSLENDGDRAKFYQVWEACSEMGIYTPKPLEFEKKKRFDTNQSVWQGRRDSNTQPTVLETATLPLSHSPKHLSHYITKKRVCQ